MTSQSGKYTTGIYILPSTSRSKDNQTMKFSQLIEFIMKSIFLGKSYTKYRGETSPRRFFWIIKINCISGTKF